MPTTTPFNNLITFSRGSNATVTGSNGLIQWAPNNLVTFSEQFDNAAWLKLAGGTGVAPVVTANVGVAPDGTKTADRVVFNRGAGTTSSDTSRIFQDVPDPSNGVGTVSFYVRSTDGASTYTMLIEAGFGTQQITVTGSWQRFSVTSTSSSLNASLRTAGDISAQTVDVLVWGAQAEIGSTATSYNPTTVKNLLGFSEAFDNAAWTKSATSIVTGAQANPVNGLFNAQKLMENTAASEHRTFFTIVTTPSTYTYSVYLKAAERTFASLTHLTVSPQPSIVVNLTTGAITSPSNVTASGAVNVGNGWWRVWMTYTTTTTTTSYPQVALFSNAATGNYTGDGNSGIFIYGAQLSDSASLDPYVPTPGAAPSSTAYYGPRFDFDPVTRQPRGILIEEQRTNLLVRSEEFDNAAWTKNELAATANAGVAPDGTTTADRLTPNAGLVTPFIFQAATTTASAFTVSFYAKADGYNFVQLSDGVSVTDYCNFNLSTGAVGASSGYTGSITNAGNGWYRCAATKTFTAVSTEIRIEPLATDIASRRPNYTANGTSGVLIWGAQLEAGSFATSYIPTIASTVTRSADVATITGSLFSQWYRQDQGAFVVDASYGTNAGWAATFEVGAGTTRMQGIRRQVSSTAASYVLPDGSTAIAGGVWANNTTAKLAGASASSNHSLVLNGAVVGTNTSVAMNNPTGLSIGRNFTGAEYFNGHIRSIDFIPFRSADFQLQNVTRQPPWNVLAADGTLYNIGGYSARTADGTAYAVPQTVLSSTGISYNVI